jgi:hypothetical protein
LKRPSNENSPDKLLKVISQSEKNAKKFINEITKINTRRNLKH